jgi:hypothetical protein
MHDKCLLHFVVQRGRARNNYRPIGIHTDRHLSSKVLESVARTHNQLPCWSTNDSHTLKLWPHAKRASNETPQQN